MSGKTWAIIPYDEALLESDLLHSQRCVVKNGANQSLARSRAQDAAEMAVHEPYPLIPSFSPSGEKVPGGRLRGDCDRFMGGESWREGNLKNGLLSPALSSFFGEEREKGCCAPSKPLAADLWSANFSLEK